MKFLIISNLDLIVEYVNHSDMVFKITSYNNDAFRGTYLYYRHNENIPVIAISDPEFYNSNRDIVNFEIDDPQ